MPHGYVLYIFAMWVVMIRVVLGVYIHIGVRLSRCSFRSTGQCESLTEWSEQQVIGFTLFYLCL